MIRSTANEAIRSPLPSAFYRDAQWYHRSLEAIFPNSWQFVAGPEQMLPEGHVRPLVLLPGSLDEPLLLSHPGGDGVRVLSNVCTHRGNLLVEQGGPARQLVCRYHGRCFDLHGHCRRQPGLDRVAGFPGAADHLVRPASATQWGMHFVRLGDGPAFADWFEPVLSRAAYLPWDTISPLAAQSRTYEVAAHWALYCDNYLEGLHIPFIHPALSGALDLEAYPVHTFPGGSLQIGLAREGEAAFDLPAGHPDAGQRIYAWYFWLFPNIMFNIYPWGLSLNVVEPLGPERTRIRFLAYAFAGAAGGPDSHALHETELEDESVVEKVMRGTRSRLYQPGAMVPEWEKAVVHFHDLVMAAMAPH